MAIQTFIVESDKSDLFISLLEKRQCKLLEVFDRDSNYKYVTIHYINVKSVFLLGFDFGAYGSIFNNN